MGASDLQNDKNGFGCMTSILAVFASIVFFIKGYTWLGWLVLAPTLLFNLASFLKYSKAIKRNKEELMKQLESLKPRTGSLKAAQFFISSDLLTKIALNEQEKRIYLWGPQESDTSKPSPGMAYAAFEYEYADILAAEMSEDGVSLGTRSSRSRMAQSVLDGFLSKIDGTFIGGSVPPEKPKKNVTSLDLTIIVNDSSRPIHTINFFKFTGEGGQAPLKKGSPAYHELLNKLRHWYMLLSFVMDETEPDHVAEMVSDPVAFEDASGHDPLSAMEELLEESRRKQLGK